MKFDGFYEVLSMIRRHIKSGGVKISYGASTWIEVEGVPGEWESAGGNFMLRPAIDCRGRADAADESVGAEAALCLSVLKALEKVCSRPELALIFAPGGRFRRLGFSSEAQREQAVWRLAQKLEPVLKALGFDWNDVL